ncbi:methyltransferase domain-containing protein [Actinomadura sp. HBU206391]|uniref:methyltransferase domain-containing protein n=1 Tax=Actinomadura sp. HBU206391 TaxID=2731692 RepID=UPI0016507526|nr:methyltransferase domain-containing protein [Actinomadura sp. HBU206391]MBC6459301.1 methyltransferase domain-containing protein [Actinomadura sp. HBU206391]
MPSVVGARQDPDDADSLAKYWTFYRAVAAAQLTRWLPRRPALILDVSGPRARCAQQAAAAGHRVVEVVDAHGPADHDDLTGDHHRVIAEAHTLGFLADGSVDAVIAENRMLSRHLVTESTVGEIARVLAPGGRLLLSVDSLMLGMAILAEQNHWAQLSDVPSAEVVLVPWPDGTITRCFWADQLRELLTDAGLEVEWIRPRTVLSPSAVDHVVSVNPDALAQLVQTELTAPLGDESVGIHLVASARRISA